MASRRRQIAMTEPEILAFLREHKEVVLVSNGKDGFPHPIPMLYHCDEAGVFWMTSYAKAMKVKNLERDPRASLVVETSATYESAKAVIAFARAEIVRDAAAVKWTFRQIAAKGIPEVPLPASGAEGDGRAAKRVALKLTPERYVSWDHAKLGGVY